MNKEEELKTKATFYETQYRKTLERFYDNEKKFCNLLTKHNRLKDEYHEVKTANVHLWIYVIISTILNAILIML